MLFTFTSDETCKRADEIVDYLQGPRLWIPPLDYPDFDRWVAKTHAQLKSEEKRALIALSYGNVVGAIVYQKHQSDPEALEIKNVTVRPDLQGRYVASFLLRNAELEGCRDYGSRVVVVDSKARNHAIGAFLRKNGYTARGVEDLYGLGAGSDVVYTKKLRARAIVVG